jgi:hypothetical protein
MPERINKLNRKIDSAAVQGEGSWVLLKSPTLEDIQAGGLPDAGDSAQAMNFGVNLLGRLVKAWNWVDDDGAPLPPPTPEIVANLPYAEVMFLMEALELGKLADQKN